MLIHAAPLSAGPALFSHDPYSIHRRSFASSSLTKRNLAIREDDASILSELEAEDNLEAEVSLASCSTECGVIKIEGVKNEKEALCSGPGLEATSECLNPPSLELASWEQAPILMDRADIPIRDLRTVHRYDLARYEIPGISHVRVQEAGRAL